ncbi:MAG: hypothetical protein L6Q95_07990 [Planctomycetes bacterium]|nr:hypothetical protein [Planctomycetota bacterium]
MRALTLLLAFAALAGCKSSRERPDRDYTSVNRESVDFLFETFREGNRIRKQNLKRDVAFSTRAQMNKRVRKDSVAAAWEAFWVEEDFKSIARARGAERKGGKERLYSMRFGFLDSGD